MKFKKKHLEIFALKQWGQDADVIVFPKTTKFNAIVRSMLTTIPVQHPKRQVDGVWLEIPFSSRTSKVYSRCWLSDADMECVEDIIQDYFFALYHNIAYKSIVVNGGQKRSRELFLAACGIGPDELKDDTFKKSFYRHMIESASFFSDFIEKCDLLSLTRW